MSDTVTYTRRRRRRRRVVSPMGVVYQEPQQAMNMMNMPMYRLHDRYQYFVRSEEYQTSKSRDYSMVKYLFY